MNSVTFTKEKIFNVKPMGQSGCRFAVKVNGKKQDGTYTKGVFINCTYRHDVLENGGLYDLSGWITDNEWNDRNTLEVVVKEAVRLSGGEQPKQRQEPKNNLPEIDINEEIIPF